MKRKQFLAMTLAVLMVAVMPVFATADVPLGASGVDAPTLRPNAKILLNAYEFGETEGNLLDLSVGEFNNQNFYISKKSFNRGANLVKSVVINDDEDAIEISFVNDYTLSVPNKPNVVIGDLAVTAKKDVNPGVEHGRPYAFFGQKEMYVGYPVEEVILDSPNGSYWYKMGAITKFCKSAEYESGVASSDESEAEDVYLEGPVHDGQQVYVDINNQVTAASRAVLNAYPDADLRFVNVITSGFPQENDVWVLADEDEFVYIVSDDGKVLDSNLKWSAKEYAQIGKIKSTTTFVISDTKLLPTDPTDPPDPPDPPKPDVPEQSETSFPSVIMTSSEFARNGDENDLLKIDAKDFTSENFSIDKKRFVKGAALIERVEFNDQNNCVELVFKNNDNLAKPAPTRPNVVIDEIAVKAKRDITPDVSNGAVFNYTGKQELWIGHESIDVLLSADGVNYDNGVINVFRKHDAVYAEASYNGDDLYLSGRVYDGDKVYLRVDQAVHEELVARVPDAELRFHTIRTNGFPSNHTLELYADKDEFVYRVGRGGTLWKSDMKWDDIKSAWICKIRSSTAFVISDIDLSKFLEDDEDPVDPPVGPDKPSNPGSSSNDGNKPATSDKIKDAADAVKDIVGAITSNNLPTGTTVGKTSNGSTIAVVPIKLVSGMANLSTDLFSTLGSVSAKVGVEFTVSSNLFSKDSVKIIIPGGFGQITEPGRIGFPMDYIPKAPDAEQMMKAVKGDGVATFTAQIGGNFTLPVAATVTVKALAPEGSIVNIYKYDPLTGKYLTIGQAKVVDGYLTFSTKQMGQMIFTTGTI